MLGDCPTTAPSCCSLQQVANHVSSRCIEMMGGVGFIKASPVEKFYRDSKIGKRRLLSVIVHATGIEVYIS